jgi:tetratricopeptide (TPR) repeat protein
MYRSCLIALSVGVLLTVTAGCQTTDKVELRYDRPAQYDVPANIRAVGIAEFGGKTLADRKWGDIASDRLAGQLDTYNNKYHRYQLVDRKRLKAVLDEQDLQSAFSDSSQAVKAGKIAKVDGMIYGSATVIVRDEQATRTSFNPLTKSSKEVTYIRRYVMTAINFTFDDVATGKTLASVPTTRDYDSDKQKDKDSGSGGLAGITKMVGIGGSNSAEPAEKVALRLIDECVQEFLAKIGPHEVVVTEPLGKGKDEAVRTGNKLAMAKEYAEALEAYDAAIRAHGDDHEAIFNSGVMYEALGKLDKAEEMYDRAFKLKPQKQYVQARKRVRQELAK